MPLSFASNLGFRHETLGASTSTSRGTTVTAGSAGTKGTWTSIGGTTSFTYEAITVFFGRSVTATNYIFDIGIQVSGTSFVIAQDIRLEGSRIAGGCTGAVYLPLHVPSGSQLQARVQGAIGAGSIDFVIIGHSQGIGGAPGYARCEAISTSTTSRGDTLLPGPTANTKGTTVVATNNAKNNYDAIWAYIASDGDSGKTTAIGWLIDIGWGSSTANAPWMIQNFPMMSEITLDLPQPLVHPLWPATIIQGGAVQARCQSTSTATADNKLDIMIYGFSH